MSRQGSFSAFYVPFSSAALQYCTHCWPVAFTFVCTEISVLPVNLSLFFYHRTRNEHGTISCAAIYLRCVQFKQVSLGWDLWLPFLSTTQASGCPSVWTDPQRDKLDVGRTWDRNIYGPKVRMDIFHTPTYFNPRQGNRKNMQAWRYTKHDRKELKK